MQFSNVQRKQELVRVIGSQFIYHEQKPPGEITGFLPRYTGFTGDMEREGSKNWYSIVLNTIARRFLTKRYPMKIADWLWADGLGCLQTLFTKCESRGSIYFVSTKNYLVKHGFNCEYS